MATSSKTEAEGGSAGEFQRFPSSVAGSYKSKSLASFEQSRWKTVKESLKSGAMIAVGLKPTRDESRHWDALKGIVVSNRQDSSSTQPPVLQASHHPKDTSIIRHVSGYDYFEATDGVGPAPPSSLVRQSLQPTSLRQMSVQSYKTDKATGRNQAIRTELKPDLWKLAVNSIRASTKLQKKGGEWSGPPAKAAAMGSFIFEGEEEERGDFTDYSVPSSPIAKFPPIPEEEEEHFFDFDYGVEETDSASVGPPPTIVRRVVSEGGAEDRPIPPKQENVRRGRIEEIKERVKKTLCVEKVNKILCGGYRSGSGGLGILTKLLNFRYNNLSPRVLRDLDSQFLHKRPYFTYWLMTVHVIIMIIALAVYGFAPYSWDLVDQRENVRQTDLSFAIQRKQVVGSVWGGPPQQALVLLGALFAPCMRLDRQLFQGIERDRQMESRMSGCCVRRDRSGCFQARQMSDCQGRFSDFFFNESATSETRAVCGTSPGTCDDPSPAFFRNGWIPTDVLTWPICRADSNENASEPHLTCEITSRPCCFGIQANCIISTREQCDFLQGRFHQDAFLCSQVDCLNEICGLLPFREFNKPDQVYRLWIALFLHAGLIHLFLSLLFSFFVLRHVEKRLGWLRTAIIYIFSGIGGNLVSAYFTPYNPEVGPAGSILGVVAYFFVFLIFERRLLKKPWIEFLKLGGVVLFFFVLGLIPYVDQFAHIGGFVFGFLISGILVPYGRYKEAWRLAGEDESKDRKYLIAKWVMVGAGLPAVLLLYVLFFVLLYVVQTTWVGFSFLTCIPFTNSLCVDQQVVLRDRGSDAIPII